MEHLEHLEHLEHQEHQADELLRTIKDSLIVHAQVSAFNCRQIVDDSVRDKLTRVVRKNRMAAFRNIIRKIIVRSFLRYQKYVHKKLKNR